MASFGFIDQKPRKIILKQGDTTITPEEVFHKMYAPLQQLVADNIQDYLHTSNRADQITTTIREEKHKRNTQTINFWGKQVPKNITATVTFDDNSEKTYKVRPRKNFKTSILKLPSIAYLDDEIGNHVMLREARNYGLEGVVKVKANRTFKNKFDLAASEQFNVNNENGANDLVQPSKNKSSVMYIPEPQALLALEQAYEEITLPRITPRMMTIDSSEDKLWYLRDYLPIALDTEINAFKMGTYLATLHTLGFMEVMDRQAVHYAIGRQGIVNYDFDFIVHTLRNDLHEDYAEFKQVIAEEQELSDTIYLDDQTKEALKKVYNEMKSLFNSKGFNNTTIFEYLHSKIDARDLPSEIQIELVKPKILTTYTTPSKFVTIYQEPKTQ